MDRPRVSLCGALVILASCAGSSPGARADPARVDSGPRTVAACPSGTGKAIGVWEDITPTEFRANPRLETTTVAVAASDPRILYASAGDKTNGGNGSVGVFRSNDCG